MAAYGWGDVNAYFKLGNKGKAILNYERALQLLPRDADVKSNLVYARSLIEGNPGPLSILHYTKERLSR